MQNTCRHPYGWALDTPFREHDDILVQTNAELMRPMAMRLVVTGTPYENTDTRQDKNISAPTPLHIWHDYFPPKLSKRS